MDRKTIDKQIFYRELPLSRDSIDVDRRLIELAFSSETPVPRFFGIETLSHDEGAVDLSRLQSGAPLLVNHDVDQLHGVVENARIDPDKVGRAVVRFSKKEDSETVFRDVLDGILTKVSVGYLIDDLEDLDRDDKNLSFDQHRILVTRWRPFEVSLVSVPADNLVGVGRAHNFTQSPEVTMTGKPNTEAPVPSPEELEKIELDRKTEIEKVAREFGERIEGGTREMTRIKEAAVQLGIPSEQFRGDVYTRIVDKAPIQLPITHLDLSRNDRQRYSLVRLVNALAARDLSLAPFEVECSKEIERVLGRPAQGTFIPYDVQTQRRDLTAGSATQGADLIQTDLAASQFIPYLYNKLQVRAMGATVLTGLQGNVAIPKHTTPSTGYWVAEGVAPTESDPAFDQVTLSPETVGTYVDVSRRLTLQSSISVEQFLRDDLAQAIATKVDYAAINGAGSSNEPQGILKVSGIGDVALGTNGAAPTYAMLWNLWREVAIDNADFGRLGWLTNAKVIAKLGTTETASGNGIFIVSTLPDQAGMLPILGMRAGVSNQVPSNLVKGTSGAVCSAMIFGNWASLLIGEWGVVDLLVDPYTSSNTGTVRIRVLFDINLKPRYAQSFAACQDILTT